MAGCCDNEENLQIHTLSSRIYGFTHPDTLQCKVCKDIYRLELAAGESPLSGELDLVKVATYEGQLDLT